MPAESCLFHCNRAKIAICIISTECRVNERKVCTKKEPTGKDGICVTGKTRCPMADIATVIRMITV